MESSLDPSKAKMLSSPTDPNGSKRNSPLLIPPKTPGSESVKVVVRCRPMTEKEIREGHERVVNLFPDKGVVEIKDLKNLSSQEVPIKNFTFDAVYDWNARQPEIYDETCRPLVDSVLEGFNGTVFAYGQTGTGKTYTMEGIREDEERRGVIPNSFEHVFNHIARSQNQQYLVRSSYLEIYQEEIRDLLAKDQTKRLELKERADVGVYVKDLSSFVCKSIKEIEHVMTIGNQNRAVGATNMNEHSSRSHAIFIITIEHSQVSPIDGQTHIRVGKLNLVDLAGSERQAKTGAVGKRQKEAIKINLSLSALGNVISALVDGKSTHVPYRDSKLTRLLQDSLGGNSKTVMIANIGPANYNYEETLTTLRYANRAKNIKNKPRVNEDPKDALLREFQLEIERLKTLLMEKQKKKKSGQLDNSMTNRDPSGKISPFNEDVAAAEAAAEQLAEKLKAMESKLLCGGKNIVDHTNEQQRELERKRQEIAEQHRREREIKQKLEEKEESTLEVRETFTSLQQEVELKKRKLRKLFSKLQSVKSEIRDSQEANARERRELEELQSELMKELKLKYLIIENFIPVEEKNKLLSGVIYDEDEDEWKQLKSSNQENKLISRRPVSCPNANRPVSEYAKIASTVGSGLRYRCENILDLELFIPPKTTKVYNLPAMSPTLSAALETALKQNSEISIDASSPLLSTIPKEINGRSNNHVRPLTTANHTKFSRPKTALKTINVLNNYHHHHPQLKRPDSASVFPESRGLIARK